MADFTFIPKIAVWEITSRCNMDCIHCGTHCGKPREGELTTDEALQLCDDLAELGCTAITLSGGEPLLRKDWDQLARRLTDNGVAVGMITNGYFLDEKAVERMQGAGIRTVGISVDGPEEKHDEIRRCTGAWERVQRGFRSLRGSGMKIQSFTTVARYNIDDLPDLQQQLIDNGVDIWQLQLCIVTGRMAEIPEMAVGPEEIRRLADFIVEAKGDGRLKVLAGENVGYFNHQEVVLRGHEDSYHGCFAGLRGIGFESNGNVKGCLSMPPEFIEGNVREQTLKEIWEDPQNFAYNRKFKVSQVEGYCRECSHLRRCRCGCAVTAHGASGSRFDNPVCLHRIEHEEQLEACAIQANEEHNSFPSG